MGNHLLIIRPCKYNLDLPWVMRFIFAPHLPRSINFNRSHDLSHRQFQVLLSEMNGDLVYYTEVLCLSRVCLLMRFFDLRDEIKFFMEQREKPNAELDDECFLNDLAFLADVTEHLDQLNTKLQGTNQIVSLMYDHVRAFTCKLVMFCSQLEKFDLTHFPSMSTLSPASAEAYVSTITDLREEFT